MKKLLIVAVTVLFLLSTLPACNLLGGEYELALVTDVGTIDDRSFNQGSWEGLERYAEDNDISYKYYQPSDKTTDDYLETIGLAVDGGAKVIVTPGYLFEPAVFIAQDEYPEIKFILLDGYPQDGTYTDFRIEDNVLSIFYAEDEAGFLAGYAAVQEGMRKLGFMGGMAVPAVIRFGYGFIQGAEYAAQELGLSEGDVEIMYTYLGDFGPSPDHQTKAAAWYNQGTEVIFAAAGGAGNSVMAAASEEGKKVIGVDVDQQAESDTVLTSAMKMLGDSVYSAIEDYYNDEFRGGESITLDVTVGGVGLPDDFSRFDNFTKAQYDDIYNKLVTDADSIRSDMVKDTLDGESVPLSDVPATIVTVTNVS